MMMMKKLYFFMFLAQLICKYMLSNFAGKTSTYLYVLH